MSFSVLELCAGGGGQALGFEMAGFTHAAAVEYEPQYCATLRHNRPQWNVIEQDIRNLNPKDFSGVDLLAAGVPCPPFSVAGKQLGSNDERDMFPTALEIIRGAKPRGVLFENVPGFYSKKFEPYLKELTRVLWSLGYTSTPAIVQAANFGVPQLRPRFVLVALKDKDFKNFIMPEGSSARTAVGESIVDLMRANGWKGAAAWAKRANKIGPTIVGGSKKHGGPDLGPTRAKMQWRELGVDGMGVANEAPDKSFPLDSLPRLTVRMVARIQGFPDNWEFPQKKTIAYRQVGNAFPPPVAKAIGLSIASAFQGKKRYPDASEAPEVQLRLLEKGSKMKSVKRKK